MPLQDPATRERVRDLVKQILNTVPTEGEDPKPAAFPERVVVNSLKEKSNSEYDRDESAKSLLTEDDLRGLDVGARLRIRQDARFTPLAADLIEQKGIQLIRKSSRGDELKVRSVAIGADHGGFETKESLKGFLSGLGLTVKDMGTRSTDAVDYPDFAHAVALAVSNNQVDAGIVIDGAGIGSAMAANKVPNVRAAACYSAALAKNSREHNGANVLTLGAGQNGKEEIEEIVRVFLTTEIREERHIKRVGKISDIEQKYKR